MKTDTASNGTMAAPIPTRTRAASAVPVPTAIFAPANRQRLEGSQTPARGILRAYFRFTKSRKRWRSVGSVLKTPVNWVVMVETWR